MTLDDCKSFCIVFSEDNYGIINHNRKQIFRCMSGSHQECLGVVFETLEHGNLQKNTTLCKNVERKKQEH